MEDYQIARQLRSVRFLIHAYPSPSQGNPPQNREIGVGFNVLEIQWDDDGRSSHNLFTTQLRPYLHTELIDAMTAAGFENIETFGDLRFNPFDSATSDTLLLTATKRRP